MCGGERRTGEKGGVGGGFEYIILPNTLTPSHTLPLTLVSFESRDELECTRLQFEHIYLATVVSNKSILAD